MTLNQSTPIKWIKSPLIDLMFIVLSPLLSLSFLFLYINSSSTLWSIPLISLLFFGLLEFPHVGLTALRSHSDPTEYNRHKIFYRWGLLLFLVGGQLIAFWSLNEYFQIAVNILSIWHISKQNIGFSKIYSTLNRLTLPPWIFRLYLGTMFSSYIFDELNGLGIINLNHSPIVFKFILIFGGLIIAGNCLYNSLKQKAPCGQVISILCLSLLIQYFLLHSGVPLIIYIVVSSTYHNLQYISWMLLFYKRTEHRISYPKFWWLYLGLGCLCLAALNSYFGGAIYNHGEMLYLSLLVFHFIIDGWIWKFSKKPELKALLLQS